MNFDPPGVPRSRIRSWGAFMDLIEPLAAEVPYM